MATALGSGIVEQKLVSAEQVFFLEPNDQAATLFKNSLVGAQRCEDEAQLIQEADVVFLSIKPQVLPKVLPTLAKNWVADRMLVSVMAGVTIQTLYQSLRSSRIVRAMPNTPCLIGQGAIGLSRSGEADITKQEMEWLVKLFDAVGVVHEVPEHLLDVVTGVSGSGPAYVYLFIEALIDAGVRQGMARPVAHSLAVQTVLGAAQMVAQTGEHPAALRDAVTSPGGTTAAALHQLETGKFRAIVSDAVKAATDRARELASS